MQAFASNFVVDVGVQSDVMNLSFLHPDPTLARDAVQQLLNQFFAQEAAVYANPQLQFAEDEAKSSREKLTAAQNALAEFKSHHQIADLQQQISQLCCHAPTWKVSWVPPGVGSWKPSSGKQR